MCIQAGVGFVVFSYLEQPPKDVKDGLPRLDDGRTIAHFESKHDMGVSYAADASAYCQKCCKT